MWHQQQNNSCSLLGDSTLFCCEPWTTHVHLQLQRAHSTQHRNLSSLTPSFSLWCGSVMCNLCLCVCVQPTAAVRLRMKGGHGGHNGLRSIMQHFGGSQDFPRLKIGECVCERGGMEETCGWACVSARLDCGKRLRCKVACHRVSISRLACKTSNTTVTVLCYAELCRAVCCATLHRYWEARGADGCRLIRAAGVSAQRNGGHQPGN